MNIIANKAFWLILSGVVVVSDQITKYLASDAMRLYDTIEIAPFFNFTLLHNTGAAFSFLSDASGWQRWFFVVLALFVSVVILVWMWRLQRDEKWVGVGLALILGGAIGNVIDRLIHGYVVDFIDVYYQTWHWPAFNIADSAITCGAIFLIWDLFTRKPELQKA